MSGPGLAGCVGPPTSREGRSNLAVTARPLDPIVTGQTGMTAVAASLLVAERTGASPWAGGQGGAALGLRAEGYRCAS